MSAAAPVPSVTTERSIERISASTVSSTPVSSESVKAITQAYEPGSTFKSVSALTILEQGTMGPEDTMFCPSSSTPVSSLSHSATSPLWGFEMRKCGVTSVPSLAMAL